MKYLSYLSMKRVFDLSYLVSMTGNKHLASVTVQNYLKKGYIRRIKKNLYCAVSIEHQGVIPSKFEIASQITDVSFVSHRSALEFYGYMHQVYSEVTVSSSKQFHDFDFEFITFIYKRTTSDLFVESIRGVRVTSLSRTIIDLIDRIRTIDDVEDIFQALKIIPALNEVEILEYLKTTKKQVLYNKVGYILGEFKEQLMLSHSFFKTLQECKVMTKRYLTSEKARLRKYQVTWNLYTYDMDSTIGEKNHV